MKAKTRILAMLLTVLMIAGILPLSLFALDVDITAASTLTGNGVYKKQTLSEIKTEFAKKGVKLSKFLSFDHGGFNDTIYQSLNKAANYSVQFNKSANTAYMDYSGSDNQAITLESGKHEAMSIAVEADGNQALLYSKPSGTSTAENYFRARCWDSADKQDYYVSFDMKMAGTWMAGGSLVTFVYRPQYAAYSATELKVSEGGGIFLNDVKLGQLSNEKYTKIAFMTDRFNNKVYFYINDVLANPEGAELFSDADVKAYNDAKGASCTASNLPIDDIRIYRMGSGLTNATRHDGVYFDNITAGNRWSYSNKTNNESVLVKSDFEGTNRVANGAYLYDNKTQFGPGGNNLGGTINKPCMVYVDEDSNGTVDAIKFTTASASDGQNYMAVNIHSTNNVSIAMDLRMGEEPILGTNALISHYFNYETDGRANMDILGVDANGNVKWGGNTNGAFITKLSSTAYTRIRVDVVTGGPANNTAIYLVYVTEPGGTEELKFTTQPTQNIVSQYLNILYFRIYAQYGADRVASLKKNDLHFKNFEVKHTSAYNTKEAPFQKKAEGFLEVDGIVRYYDGKGGYATEDFFVGSTKYMVGNDGEIISKISGSLPERDLAALQTEFADKGLDLKLYQSFNSTNLIEAEKTEYSFEATSGMLLSNTFECLNGSGGFNFKNLRPVFDLKKDAAGNTALYHGSEASVEGNNDAYFDLSLGLGRTYETVSGNATHDLYISFDLKMGGANITSAPLFNLLFRPKDVGAVYHQHVWLSAEGGIYASDNFSPDQLLGFLSGDEYTRIAFATNRLNNKAYVYINDVLVTPDGIELFSQAAVDKMNTNEPGVYTASTIPIDTVRVYITGNDGFDSYTLNQHKGLYMDNIVYGACEKSDDRISVFESKPAGLHGIGGIYRYYDGNGSFKTKDFTDANGVKYVVGFNGSATRESDGREFAPYAPYVDWQHSSSAAYIINNTKASNFSSQVGMAYMRDVYIKDAALNNENIMLITTYKDLEWVAEPVAFEGETSRSGNSYMEINPSTAYDHDKHMVLDFDIMLGELFTKADSPSHPFFQVCGRDATGTRVSSGANSTDYQFLSIAKDGWLIDNNNKTPFVKLSKNEFTRISVVFHTPQLETVGGVNKVKQQMTIDIYANGVLVKKYEETNANIVTFDWLRFFQMSDEDFSMYVKNLCMYEGEKPQQFYTMVGEFPMLTADQNAAPAEAKNLKTGYVKENGVVRYYDELGLPIISGAGEVITDKYGKVQGVCDGTNHLEGDNGLCLVCGTKLDGVTSMHGHNLVLGDDVKVNFYLNIDINNAKAEGAQVIVGIKDGRQKTFEISELTRYPEGGENCYVVSFPVPAKDIGAEINVQLIKAGENFTEYSYSAQTYIDKVTAAPIGGDITQELKDLVKALGVYGKNAAAVLKTGSTVATDDVDWNSVADADGDKTGNVKLTTFSLDLKSKIRLRVYFEISGSLSDYTVTVDGKAVNPIDVGGGVYCIDYAVFAKNLNKNVRIVITGSGSNLWLEMAPLYYAKIMVEKNETPAYKNLMNAIKLYSDATSAYAG